MKVSCCLQTHLQATQEIVCVSSGADDIVQDKIRSFEAYLSMTVQSLIMHQNSEMFRIPADLRKMTIREIQDKWGGSLAGTVQKMKREKIEAEERERIRVEEEERRLAAKRFVCLRSWHTC